MQEHGTIAVPGASPIEQHRLAALGGVVANITEGVPEQWHPKIRQWAEAAPSPPLDILESVRELLGRHEDALGALYNASISPANRRRLGTVFTPPGLVAHMFQLVKRELDEPPKVVVDPGAGVGAFTIGAIQTWPEARIIASDINPVTLGLLGARLLFEADAEPELADRYRNVDLRLGDYLDELGPLFEQTAPGPVLVLGNPPYTRVQELSARDRAKASRMAGDLIDSGHANLAMLFQAATLRHMRPHDVSCMVVPGSFSYTRASRALRRAMWRSKRQVVIHRTPAASKVFTGRSVQAAVLMVGRERTRREPLQLGRIDLNGTGVEALRTWRLSRGGREPENWFWTPRGSTPPNRKATQLGEVAAVRRGTATGANEMFFLDDATQAGLPPQVVLPAVLTLRGFQADELTERTHADYGDASARRWLLAIPPEMQLEGALADYVNRHRDLVRDRHLAQQRAVWYAITDLPRPQILITPLASSRFKVVVNSLGAVPSNNLFGISQVPDGHVDELADWLRSEPGQRTLLRASRRYPGGSHKLEPGDLSRVELPMSLARKVGRR